jgi:hypothetical protein
MNQTSYKCGICNYVSDLEDKTRVCKNCAAFLFKKDRIASWTCQLCTHINPGTKSCCLQCTLRKVVIELDEKEEGPVQHPANYIASNTIPIRKDGPRQQERKAHFVAREAQACPNKWHCKRCTFDNNMEVTVCVMCDTPKTLPTKPREINDLQDCLKWESYSFDSELGVSEFPIQVCIVCHIQVNSYNGAWGMLRGKESWFCQDCAFNVQM